MKDCVTDVHECAKQLEDAAVTAAEVERDLGLCSGELQVEAPSLGVLGAALAFLLLVDLVRLMWMRHHGTAGPLFPWDM